MDWDAFLDTAGRLATGSTEGDWRSSVSRAYYAVFHFFLGWFRTNGITLGRSGLVHQNLYLGLFNCGVPAMQPLARDVDWLRDKRTWADYDLTTPLPQTQAATAVQKATAIVANFQVILTSVPAATIATGFHSYLQRIGRLPP